MPPIEQNLNVKVSVRYINQIIQIQCMEQETKEIMSNFYLLFYFHTKPHIHFIYHKFVSGTQNSAEAIPLMKHNYHYETDL